LLQKSPLRPEQVDTMARHIGVGQDIGEDEYGNLPEILYSPFGDPKDKYQTLLSDLVKSANLKQVYASNPEML